MAHETPAELVAEIQSQLEYEWARFRERSHNPSNKGDSYENELKELLGEYFSGGYELISQPVFIDPELEVFDEFDTGRGEHELDVVGLFRQSKPRIVFELSEMKYVPLEGVAFICEVKSQLDKQKLKKDLNKLRKVDSLCDFEREIIPGFGKEYYATTPPVKCLIYDQDNISSESFKELIGEYHNCWDMILVVQSEKLVVNLDLPVRDIIHPSRSTQMDEARYAEMGNSFINFLGLLSLLVPSPVVVHTTITFESLIHEYVSSDDV